MQEILKKLVVIVMMSVPGPFNGYHEMRRNSAVIRQNQLELWNQKAKQIFTWQSKNFGPRANNLGPRPFIVESLKETWDQQSLIYKQNFAIANWQFCIMDNNIFHKIITVFIKLRNLSLSRLKA